MKSDNVKLGYFIWCDCSGDLDEFEKEVAPTRMPMDERNELY